MPSHPMPPLPKSMLALVLMLVFLSSSPGVAHDPAGQTYHSATFGFTIDLAGLGSAFQTVTSPEGITLTSPDRRAVVNVFGSWNDAGRSLSGLVDQFKHSLPDAEFTYEWHGRRSAVLSGYQAGDIFYVRMAMSPDGSRVAVLNMIYDPELKHQLDQAVTQLSNSLTIR